MCKYFVKICSTCKKFEKVAKLAIDALGNVTFNP